LRQRGISVPAGQTAVGRNMKPVVRRDSLRTGPKPDTPWETRQFSQKLPGLLQDCPALSACAPKAWPAENTALAECPLYDKLCTAEILLPGCRIRLHLPRDVARRIAIRLAGRRADVCACACNPDQG